MLTWKIKCYSNKSMQLLSWDAIQPLHNGWYKQDIYINLLLCAEAGLYLQHLLKQAHVSERPTCYVEVTLVANNMQQNIFAVLHSSTAWFKCKFIISPSAHFHFHGSAPFISFHWCSQLFVIYCIYYISFVLHSPLPLGLSSNFSPCF